MPTRTQNFDSVARIYRWAEYLSLGTLLERTREHFLPKLTNCRHALALGDGDGRFLAHLLNQNLDLKATAVDTSAAMLQQLRTRCGFAESRMQTLQASALDVSVPNNTDLIITHFFLDCLTQSEINTLTTDLAAQVVPGTMWLLSDFAIPNHPLLRPLAALYIRALYFSFSILTGLKTSCLPDPQTAFTNAGFQRTARHERLFGLIYTELWRRQ
jgi:ubiquinone/menaquinone biosynthesis C-methylase UbiE